jgi:cytochrome c oxidase subunit 2
MTLNRANLKTAFTFIARLSAALLVYVGYSAAPSPPRAQAEPRTVEVVAKRFEFEPSRIEVTEGQTVKILVRSADGLHGFGIKKFKVSEEVPRGGQPISIEFTATAVGEFEILCSEYCGKGHEAMKGKLVVRARDAGSR